MATVNKSDRKNDYELVFITKEADASTMETIRNGIKENLAKRSSEVKKMVEMGTRKFFHEKDHQKRGNFNCWLISAPANMIQSINADLRVNTNVIKTILVKAGS